MKRAMIASRRRRLTPRGRVFVTEGEYVGQVLASEDNAHEYISGPESGSVFLDFDPLPLGFEGVHYLGDDPATNARTRVGLRFRDVLIAQGESIAFAQVRLVAARGNTKPFIARLRAEASDNSMPFTTASGNISARPVTTAYVDWDVPPWTIGLSGEDTWSPNIAALVQEVVGRAGWQPGGSITIFVETSPANTDPEWPARRAYALSGDAGSAARLLIGTTDDPAPPPPPPVTGDFSDGFDTYGLEGNELFNPSSPKLKDGTAFNSEMSLRYDQMMNSFLSSSANTYVRIESVFGHSDVYQSSRRGQYSQESAMHAFRLTGDLRILDRLCVGYGLMHDNSSFANGWSGHNVDLLNNRSVQWGSAGVTRGGKVMQGNPWSPYHRSLKYINRSTDYRYETDIYLFNENKHRSLMAEFAWALHLNRGKTSPQGHDYAALADRWAGHLDDWWWSWSGATNTDWGDWNYRGNDRPFHNEFSAGRAPPGSWPLMYADEGHGIFSSLTLEPTIGRLGMHGQKAGGAPMTIQNPEGAKAGADKIATVLTHEYGWVPCVNSYARPSIILRGAYHYARNYRWVEPARQTYVGYSSLSLVTLFLRGVGAQPSVFSRENLLRLSRSASDGMNSDGSTKSFFGGDVDRCGHGLSYANPTPQSASAAGYRAMAALVVFADGGEPEGVHLVSAANAAANAAGSSRDWPTRGPQFVRAALLATGGLDE